jgi:hypothetical protein
MVIPAPSGPSLPEWTYSGDAVLDTDPDSLRDRAKNIAKIGKNLQDDLMGPMMLLHGGGEDVSLSTGGFAEGGICDQLNSRNASELSAFAPDLHTNLVALSSVMHVLADLYETTDAENTSAITGSATLGAVEWAFGDPRADKPANLPYYLQDAKTLEELAEQGKRPDTVMSDDVVIASGTFTGGNYVTYQSDDGRTRTVVNTRQGRTVTGYTKDGTVEYEVHSGDDGDSVIRKNYHDGELVSTTTRTHTVTEDGNETHERTSSRTVYADGRKPTDGPTEHMVTTEYDDGTHTREYYTTEEVKDDEGRTTVERSDERYIGRQPDAVTTQDWLELSERKMTQAGVQAGQ